MPTGESTRIRTAVFPRFRLDIFVPKDRNRAIVFAIASLVGIIVLRGRSLYNPFSDPTAGLYLHIGHSWLNGHLPYTQTWDYRPPGYFAMYAGAMTLFGARFARDALAVIALAATAYAAAAIAIRADAKSRVSAGYWAALFFILLSPTNDGIAGVAELQISAFVSLALLAACRRRLMVWPTALACLCASLAIQCKLSALPLAFIPLSIVAVRMRRDARLALVAITSFVLPIFVETIVYARAGELFALWDANVGATLRRLATAGAADEFARNRENFVKQLFALAPVIEFAFLALSKVVNSARFLTVGWTVAALLSIVAAGEFYERQFVLLTAPVAILGAIGFINTLDRLSNMRERRIVAIATVLVTFALHDYFEVNQTMAYTLHRAIERDATWRLDQSAEVAETLACANPSSESVFLVEQNPYIYDLLGLTAPKFAYTDHLLDPRLSYMAGIDGTRELKRILAGSPDRIVVSHLDDFRYDQHRVSILRGVIAASYVLETSEPHFDVFKRGGLAPMPSSCTHARNLAP